MKTNDEIIAEIQRLTRFDDTSMTAYTAGYRRALRDIWKFVDPTMGMSVLNIPGLGVMPKKPE